MVPPSPLREDARETLEMTFKCMGVDLGGDDCILDALFEVMDLGELRRSLGVRRGRSLPPMRPTASRSPRPA